MLRFLITSLLGLCFFGQVAIDKMPPASKWHSAQRDLRLGSFQGLATLRVVKTIPDGKTEIPLGAKFEVDIRFSNTAGGDDFYNPFLCELVPLPAKLAVYDSQKKYRGDLLERIAGSRKTVSTNDWTYIPGNGYVGCTKRVTAGRFRNPLYGKLPPGTYYLQMIYLKRFITLNPARTDRGGKVDQKQFDTPQAREELFRSNMIEIKFTDPYEQKKNTVLR